MNNTQIKFFLNGNELKFKACIGKKAAYCKSLPAKCFIEGKMLRAAYNTQFNARAIGVEVREVSQ